MKAIITNLDAQTSYVVHQAGDCRDATDRTAYKESVRLAYRYQLGHVLVQPLPNKPITKMQLVAALFHSTTDAINPAAERLGMSRIESIEREDGSGRSFNVTGITPCGAKFTTYVRTID